MIEEPAKRLSLKVPSAHLLQANLHRLLTEDYSKASVHEVRIAVGEALGAECFAPINIHESEDMTIFRGRKNLSEKEVDRLSSFHAPPPHLTGLGRANLPGMPVFYGALEPQACALELRAAHDEKIWLAEFVKPAGTALIPTIYIAYDPETRDLDDPSNNILTQWIDEILSEKVAGIRSNNTREELIAAFNAKAQLFTHQKTYTISARLAHEAIYYFNRRTDTNMNCAIIYASVHDRSLHNIAINPGYAAANLRPKRFLECNWNASRGSLKLKALGTIAQEDPAQIVWNSSIKDEEISDLLHDWPFGSLQFN